MGAGGFIATHDMLFQELSTTALTLLGLMGFFYLSGIIFFALGEYRPIYHVVWHLFVILAAAMHWFCVYLFIVPVDIDLGPSPLKTTVEDMVSNLINILKNSISFDWIIFTLTLSLL